VSASGPDGFRVVSLRNARAAIAHTLLGAPDVIARLGDVTLLDHQRDGAARLQQVLARWGGALLCDEVGLGKTYTALAVAAALRVAPLVVAPASLRTMWRHASAATHVPLEIITMERLSRPGIPRRWRQATSLVIVDEAHHARNPATRRHASLAALCSGVSVLLLSATPLHNKRADVIALLALFIGPRAETMSDEEISRLVVRRRHTGPVGSANIPAVHDGEWHTIIRERWLLQRILALPPPVPPSDGGTAPALVPRGLVRQWASSEAALRGALRRRLAHGAALEAALACGRKPDRAALRAWHCGDDAVQLAFPELLARTPVPDADIPTLARAVAEHTDAVRALMRDTSSGARDDERRARYLRTLRQRHAPERIVAFASYGDTVRALYTRLRGDGGVAMLSSSGGLVAGGPVSRAELLSRLAPHSGGRTAPSGDDVTLLLTTDLAAEGVNLQGASVVVHLDLPWTAARMEQRIGRLARIGSAHGVVTSCGIRPPRNVERYLRATLLIQRKRREATRLLGAASQQASMQASPGRSASAVVCAERILETLREWAASDCGTGAAAASEPVVALSSTPGRSGFLAACLVAGRPTLVARRDSGAVTADPRVVLPLLHAVARPSPDLPSSSEAAAGVVSAAVNALTRWAAGLRAREDAGVPDRLTRSAAATSRRTAIRVAAARANSPFSVRYGHAHPDEPRRDRQGIDDRTERLFDPPDRASDPRITDPAAPGEVALQLAGLVVLVPGPAD